MKIIDKKHLDKSIRQFNDISDDLIRSDNNTFMDRLSQFFQFTENDELFHYIHEQLLKNPNTNVDIWFEEKLSKRSSMVGSAPLEFPKNIDDRLSIQYQLLNSINLRKIHYRDFMINFFGTTYQPYAFNEAISIPLFRGMKYKIEEIVEKIPIENSTSIKPETQLVKKDVTNMINNKTLWEEINNSYGMSKKSFARKIYFVEDKYRRTTIFRDIGHAHYLSTNSFSKPAVILVGSVIEELLRLFLIHKGITINSNSNFNDYIRLCESNGLLKTGINRLSDSVRHFRNYVHLAKETDKKHAISKSTAIGAVASIFTLANDF